MGVINKHETREQRFSCLYQDTRDEILAYLVRRARSTEDAADALSETYAAAWRKLDTLPEGDGARLWLFGAARMELRMAARRERADDELNAELASELQAIHGEPIRAAESQESLWQAIAGLSSLDREILTLTAWEELTPREIAAVHGHVRQRRPGPAPQGPTWAANAPGTRGRVTGAGAAGHTDTPARRDETRCRVPLTGHPTA